MTQTTPTPSLSLRQQAALIATENLLRAGLLVHKSDDDVSAAPEGAIFFNMNYWIEETGRDVDYGLDDDEGDDFSYRHCGTFMCIGGTTEWMLGKMTFDNECGLSTVADADPGLYDLFYPGQNDLPGRSESERMAVQGYAWDRITGPMAANAIKNYRESGDPQWYSVLGLGDE